MGDKDMSEYQLSQLSILYLRCGCHTAQLQCVGQMSFNSLFEMPAQTSSSPHTPGGTFNSLFEMHERAEILRTVASIVFQFSI